jgi:hypothetical protein
VPSRRDRLTLPRRGASSKILVWKVRSKTAPTVATVRAGARTPAIAATPDGRLWVAWSAKGRIWARRSNRARTIWGATTSIPVKSHTDTVYKLALSAQNGVLDLLAAFSPSSTGDVQTWHSQIDPGLKVVTHPSTVRVPKGHGFKLKITVSDAGSAVAHATLTAAGHHVHTGAHGTASITLGPFKRPTSLHVTAVKTGYAPGTATVRVRVQQGHLSESARPALSTSNLYLRRAPHEA